MPGILNVRQRSIEHMKQKFGSQIQTRFSLFKSKRDRTLDLHKPEIRRHLADQVYKQYVDQRSKGMNVTFEWVWMECLEVILSARHVRGIEVETVQALVSLIKALPLEHLESQRPRLRKIIKDEMISQCLKQLDENKGPKSLFAAKLLAHGWITKEIALAYAKDQDSLNYYVRVLEKECYPDETVAYDHLLQHMERHEFFDVPILLRDFLEEEIRHNQESILARLTASI